ncbi:MAG: ParB/RepB/Spo0J family partition protein [Syntrophomonadaceae bacterium]|nr:ParB/RepB/Spo0J family partition protein [Syntrophomonadaceae bacterium]
MVKRGLGRGLEALLPNLDQEKEGVLELPIERIAVSPYQPRRDFDDDRLAELASSIKEYGVVQPIIVRRLEAGKYQLIAGERRLRACQALGMERIPAVVRESSDLQAREISLVENIQREELNPIEEAEAYRELIADYGLTQEELARKIGRSRPHIANTLRLLTLPGEIKEMVRSGSLAMGHAKALLSVGDEEARIRLGQLVAEKGLSVREAEELAWREKPAPDSRARAAKVPPATELPNIGLTAHDIREGEAYWGRVLDARVKIRWLPRGRWKVEIEMEHPDDLYRLEKRMGINFLRNR